MSSASSDAPAGATATASSPSPSPSPFQPHPSPTAALLVAHQESQAEEDAGKRAAIDAMQPAEQEKRLWYFAIGSMMNITSMNLRNLFPSESKPGILRGWKLVFRGGGGMGDIDQAEGESFHGILHHLTHAEFAHLDTIEGMYLRTPVEVEDYAGNRVAAFAYKMDQSKIDKSLPDALPGERYLDIIMRGARHFGVDPAYIAWLEKVPVMPRKRIEEFRKVQTPPDVVITREELSRSRGAAEGFSKDHPLMLSVNGKVLRWAEAPSTDAQRFGYNFARSRYAGQEVVCSTAKTLYEPRFPVPTCYEEMGEDCKAWGEELFVGFQLRGAGMKQEGYRMGNFEVIGWLEGHEPAHLRKPAQPDVPSA